jgi:hypothetical protein
MSEFKPNDPIAERLKAASAKKKAEADISKGQQLLREDAARAARELGPEQLQELKKALEERCESYNRSKSPELPVFRFVPAGRVDVGKFAIALYPFLGLNEYGLTVSVGLHPNAAQFMPEVPDIASLHLRLVARLDDNGFFWWNTASEVRRSNLSVATAAFAYLCELLEGDLPS